MANTLTDLVPDLYAALDVVSRELIGFIPAVNRNSTAERAEVGKPVRVPVTGAANVVDIAPSMAIPEPTDQTVDNVDIVMTKSRAAEFGFVGEEQRGLSYGAGYLTVQGDMIAQAMRTLANEVESDIAATYYATSRAFGTAGVTPFASTLTDTANVKKILDDNGAPQSFRSLVINTTAGAKLRTLTQLTKANEAGTTMTLRQGELLDVHGISIKESAQIKTHTQGTGASATTDTAGYAVGDTVITLAGVGTGTIVIGDVLTFAGDDNQYVVAVGVGAVSGGTITLAAPGLVEPIVGATALTVTADYTANMAFSQNAIVLASRLPALPQEGDLALDRMTLTDPRSGLTFEVSIYGGYRKVRYEIALTWGVKNIKPEHSMILLG
jgi:hypothetical protein